MKRTSHLLSTSSKTTLGTAILSLVLLFTACDANNANSIGSKAHTGTASSTTMANESDRQNNHRKIIVFREDFRDQNRQKALVAAFGGTVEKPLTLVNALTVTLPDQVTISRLAGEAGVLRVDNDAIVHASERGFLDSRPLEDRIERNRPAKPGRGERDERADGSRLPQPGEVLPWGVDRIDADIAINTTTGRGVKVAVLDTGIDLDHPDLQNRIKKQYSALLLNKSADDDNGHGTHVAGTIAAIGNDIGVIGVGPEIDLYAVKVLKRSGSGFTSDIIEGIEWSIAEQVDVINLSLGSAEAVESLHQAIRMAVDAGIVVIAAAGNESGPVSYPAVFPETIAVSATDQNDMIAVFSNRGPEVEIAAPGVEIYSTAPRGRYVEMSGTSMAAPHVAAVAALVIGTPVSGNDTNGNGRWDPAEVRQVLLSSAEDLGSPGNDSLYGAGLVDAEAAVR